MYQTLTMKNKTAIIKEDILNAEKSLTLAYDLFQKNQLAFAGHLQTWIEGYHFFKSGDFF